MKKIFFLLLTICASYAGYSQNKDEATAISFVGSTCSTGAHKLDILEKDIPQDLKEIILRYRKAVSDSMDWYNGYSQAHKSDDPLPYHPNFGISEMEYNRMNKEFPQLKMKVRTTKTLTINKADGQLGFKGDGGFSILDAVVFDMNNKTLLIDGQQIPYTGEVSEGETSGIGSWKGYHWRLEIGNIEDVKAFKEVDYTMIDLCIGKTQSNNIVLQYKTMLVAGGEPKINGSLTAFLK